MSALQVKHAARREQQIQDEVERKLDQLEIDQRVREHDPFLQERMQTWIKTEVEKAMRAMQVDIAQQVRHSVELEVGIYCGSLWNRNRDDSHFTRVRSPTPLPADEILPASPPLLQRQDGHMINHIDEEEVKEIEDAWDIANL
jgi:hypothetical protein